MPSRRLRVVCGFGVTIASFSPTRAFSSVDLPAFGRPSSATTPARCSRFRRHGHPGARAPPAPPPRSALRFERPLPRPQVSPLDADFDREALLVVIDAAVRRRSRSSAWRGTSRGPTPGTRSSDRARRPRRPPRSRERRCGAAAAVAGSRPPSRKTAPISASRQLASTRSLSSPAERRSVRPSSTRRPSPSERATSASACWFTSAARARVSSPSAQSGCARVERVRDHEIEHRVAEELEPLVAAAAVHLVGPRRVRERGARERGVAEDVAEHLVDATARRSARHAALTTSDSAIQPPPSTTSPASKTAAWPGVTALHGRVEAHQRAAVRLRRHPGRRRPRGGGARARCARIGAGGGAPAIQFTRSSRAPCAASARQRSHPHAIARRVEAGHVEALRRGDAEAAPLARP